MFSYIYREKSTVDTPIEESIETLANATALVRRLIADKTGRGFGDIYTPTLIYCAKECCLETGSPEQNAWSVIEKKANLIADTSAVVQSSLSKALVCAVEDIPLRQIMNLALDVISEQEWRIFSQNKPIEESIETLANATALVRRLIADKTGRGVEDVPIVTLLFCARECCLDGGYPEQNAWSVIEKHAHLLADTSAVVQSYLAKALSCAVEEVPLRQIMNLALEAIWEQEERMVNKYEAEHPGELTKLLDEDWSLC